ncbi:short-chain fatty acid transporter, partial [Cytophagaceae bacterium AH-315-L13]|nr:short-chain fatty acid transporter [Cytophagaceae bacterium AH-315-L13]
ITKNNGLEQKESVEVTGAEKLDHSKWFCYLFAFLIIIVGVNKAFIKPEEVSLRFINPDFINFILLGLGLALHGTFSKYLNAVESAIKGTTGILIQFPIYAGIMGIMKYSGLVMVFSDFFVQISNQTTFPIFTFISAALVNIFVPSGGGQWAVQGPIIVEAARELGVSIPKCIMALAYGDQLTNMMQPFWALPLLGITGLKAKEILPYTLFLMCIGAVIFLTGLLIF